MRRCRNATRSYKRTFAARSCQLITCKQDAAASCEWSPAGTESDLIGIAQPGRDACEILGSRAMSHKSRLPGETGDELPRELIELGKKIAAIPMAYQRD